MFSESHGNIRLSALRFASIKFISGFMLIELMIAVGLSAIVSSIVIDLYLASLHGYQLQSDLATIQNNMINAESILKSEIQLAGNVGCAKLTDEFPIAQDSTFTLTPENKLSVSASEFTVRYGKFVGNQLTQSMLDHETLFVSHHKKFNKNDVLIISDCQHAEIFEIKNISFRQHEQQIVATKHLQYQFNEHAEVGEFVQDRFYISQNTLMVQKNGAKHFKLVPGVVSMQIQNLLDHDLLHIELDFSSGTLKKKGYLDVALS